jgi:hypothetical protein
MERQKHTLENSCDSSEVKLEMFYNAPGFCLFVFCCCFLVVLGLPSHFSPPTSASCIAGVTSVDHPVWLVL